MSDVLRFIVARYEDGSLSAQKCISMIRIELGMQKRPEYGNDMIGGGNPPSWPHHSEVPADITINDMALSQRTQGAFVRAELKTAKDVVEFGASKLLRLENFGKKSLREFEEVLKNMMGQRR